MAVVILENNRQSRAAVGRLPQKLLVGLSGGCLIHDRFVLLIEPENVRGDGDAVSRSNASRPIHTNFHYRKIPFVNFRAPRVRDPFPQSRPATDGTPEATARPTSGAFARAPRRVRPPTEAPRAPDAGTVAVRESMPQGAVFGKPVALWVPQKRARCRSPRPRPSSAAPATPGRREAPSSHDRWPKGKNPETARGAPGSRRVQSAGQPDY